MPATVSAIHGPKPMVKLTVARTAYENQRPKRTVLHNHGTALKSTAARP
ncbi:hypothetical protein [Adhaeretor mobilis]|nr:hypothetical protein [Adhaeretor mobilis]